MSKVHISQPFVAAKATSARRIAVWPVGAQVSTAWAQMVALRDHARLVASDGAVLVGLQGVDPHGRDCPPVGGLLGRQRGP